MTMGTNGGYGRGRPRFTPEDRHDILTRYDNGEPVQRLAREYGCAPSAIRYHLKTTLRVTPAAYRDAAPGSRHCDRCGIESPQPLCTDCVDVMAGSPL